MVLVLAVVPPAVVLLVLEGEPRIGLATSSTEPRIKKRIIKIL